jgi:succinate dehydrogenase hydrophobic anchor subunit
MSILKKILSAFRRIAAVVLVVYVGLIIYFAMQHFIVKKNEADCYSPERHTIFHFQFYIFPKCP